MSKEILTPKDLAEYLSIGVDKVYKMRANGEIPFCLVGGSIRFMKSEIDNWLLSKTNKGDKNE